MSTMERRIISNPISLPAESRVYSDSSQYYESNYERREYTVHSTSGSAHMPIGSVAASVPIGSDMGIRMVQDDGLSTGRGDLVRSRSYEDNLTVLPMHPSGQTLSDSGGFLTIPRTYHSSQNQMAYENYRYESNSLPSRNRARSFTAGDIDDGPPFIDGTMRAMHSTELDPGLIRIETELEPIQHRSGRHANSTVASVSDIGNKLKDNTSGNGESGYNSVEQNLFVINKGENHKKSDVVKKAANGHGTGVYGRSMTSVDRYSLDGTQKVSTYGVSSAVSKKKHRCCDGRNYTRGNWTWRTDFIFAGIAYTFSIGNVWRFPMMLYRNGGGAFLIPYVVMLFAIGVPMFLMEVALGQYTSAGCITCWGCSPFFLGIGVGMVIALSFLAIYFSMYLAWALFYLVTSFNDPLPWSTCNNTWNSKDCYQTIACKSVDHSRSGYTSCLRVVLPSEEYFHNFMLNYTSSPGMHEPGHIRWQLLLALIAVWILVLICLIRGHRSLSKIIYVTFIVALILLVILFLRPLSLDGYSEGIIHIITPNWNRLTDVRVWGDAANQVVFSLFVCWGGIIFLASYNRFHIDSFRDSLVIIFVNLLLNILVAVVTGAYLGILAKHLKTNIDFLVASNSDPWISGFKIPFLILPSAFLAVPTSTLWAVVYFLFLSLVGLDTQFITTQAIITGVADLSPFYLRRHQGRFGIVIIMLLLLIGLAMATPGGVYTVFLLEVYVVSWPILILGICECLAVGWIYGWQHFAQDIQIMTGSRPWMWWRICWLVITPLVLLIAVIFTFIGFAYRTKYHNYTYAAWALALGWLVAISIVIFVAIVALIQLCRRRGKTFYDRILRATRPFDSWGPLCEKHRRYPDGRLELVESRKEGSLDTVDKTHSKSNDYEIQQIQLHLTKDGCVDDVKYMSMYDKGDRLDELSLIDSDYANEVNRGPKFVGYLESNNTLNRSQQARPRSRSPGPHNIGARLDAPSTPFVSVQSASVTDSIHGETLERRSRDNIEFLRVPSYSHRDEVFVNPAYEPERPPSTLIYRVN